MRNLKVIGKTFVDVYDNMFSLLAMNIIWALLAALPVSVMIGVLQIAVETPETASTAWVVLTLAAVVYVLMTAPATYALAVMARRIVDYEATSVREFFSVMRANLKRAWLLGLVSVGGTALLLVNLAFYATLGGLAAVLVPLFLLITLLWLILQLYLFPVAVITEGGISLTLRNAAIVLFRYPGMAVLVSIVALILIILSSVLILPWVILTMAVLASLGTRAVRSAVRRDRGQPEEDPLSDEPLPPIGGEEATPAWPPRYGWRPNQPAAPDEETTPRA